MKRFKILMVFTILTLLITIACSQRGASSDADESKVVKPELPVPLQEPGKGFVYNFNSDTVGQMPAKFHSALTGHGAMGEWIIKSDPTAPSQPNVLAQTSADKT